MSKKKLLFRYFKPTDESFFSWNIYQYISLWNKALIPHTMWFIQIVWSCLHWDPASKIMQKAIFMLEFLETIKETGWRQSKQIRLNYNLKLCNYFHKYLNISLHLEIFLKFLFFVTNFRTYIYISIILIHLAMGKDKLGNSKSLKLRIFK